MGRGVGITRIVNIANAAAAGESGAWNHMRSDGPAKYAKEGKWKVELEGNIGRLYHYGTKMLEWRYGRRTLPMSIEITGWWVGWGSASDQEGVNAALRALGSEKHYYRDARGGGPRVNPGYRVSASVGRAASSISSITPPEY
jgi:hypothetical protein